MPEPRKRRPDARPVPAQTVAAARRLAPHRRGAELRMRILEKLALGMSVARIAQAEKLTVRRVRQIVAEALAKRETDPPAGFVQLQIARLSDAIMVAHSMMMNGDLAAMDRFLRVTGELDRYHGLLGGAAAAPPAPAPTPRLAAPQPRLSLPVSAAPERIGEILSNAER